MAVPVSASVSDEFFVLMEKHGISPTEAMRVGLSLKFCELGISPYKTFVNEDRLNMVNAFEKDSTLSKKYQEYKEFGKFMHYSKELHELLGRILKNDDK